MQTVHYPGQCTEKKRKKKRKKKKKKKTRESAFVSSLTRNTASVSRLLRGVGRSKGGRIGVAGWLAFCFGLHSAGCAYLAAQHGAKLHCNIAIKAVEWREEMEGGTEEHEESEDEREREKPFEGRKGKEKKRRGRGKEGDRGRNVEGAKRIFVVIKSLRFLNAARFRGERDEDNEEWKKRRGEEYEEEEEEEEEEARGGGGGGGGTCPLRGGRKKRGNSRREKRRHDDRAINNTGEKGDRLQHSAQMLNRYQFNGGQSASGWAGPRWTGLERGAAVGDAAGRHVGSRLESPRNRGVGMKRLVSPLPSQRPVSLAAADLDSRPDSPRIRSSPCAENTALSITT